MLKKYLLASVTCIAIFLVAATYVRGRHTAENLYAVPFDDAMRLQDFPQKLSEPVNKYFYDRFKATYEKNHPGKLLSKNNNTVKIPKIIHQIWLGSPFPEKYRAFQESWKKQHPDWEYRLWTEKELALFPMKHRDLFEAANNYGEKSDIARYEILYQMGGLYVDTDFECLQPFDSLHRAYDFFIGIQPLDTSCVQLGIGLIGSVPKHKLLQCCLDNLRQNCKNYHQIIQRTGPLYFTQVFGAVAPSLSDATIALPTSFVYPRGYYQSAEEKNKWLCPESFAVHHWEGSWLKKEAFVSHA